MCSVDTGCRPTCITVLLCDQYGRQPHQEEVKDEGEVEESKEEEVEEEDRKGSQEKMVVKKKRRKPRLSVGGKVHREDEEKEKAMGDVTEGTRKRMRTSGKKVKERSPRMNTKLTL